MVKWLIAIAGVLVLVCAAGVAAQELQIGAKASDWSFKDADGKAFSMESWAGRVLLVTYVDPDESDLNEHFTDAMKKAKDDGRLKEETYKGIGIADCAATWKPNVLIRMIAGDKAKKYKTVILFDTDASLRTAWGLTKDTSNVILLDKDRVCRAIVRGRVPDDQVASLVQLAVDLQAK
jgi:predicted transcriptional regulator